MRKPDLALCFLLASIASSAFSANFFWNGPDLETWDAADNNGLTWWRIGATNGAYSATLPGTDDVCYDFQTNITLRPTVDLGTAGHFATLHLGSGANWGYSASTGNNPVVVDSGTANCGTASGDAVWHGSVTLNGNLQVVKSEASHLVQLYGQITGSGQLTFANVGPAFLFSTSNDFRGGLVLSSNASVYAASCGAGAIFIEHGAMLCLNSNQNWTLTNAISGFGTNLIWNGTRTLTLSGSTLTTGTSATPGMLTVVGNLVLTNSAILSVVLGGPFGNGQLVVAGTAGLCGARLDVSFANGFIPGPNDTFTVLTCTGSVPGPFSNDSHGVVQFSNGWQANVSYAATSGGCTVAIGNLMRTTPGSGFRLR